MFKDFDFNVLSDPEFKEDSVREDLLVPIVQALGYKSSGEAKVVRSRALINPLVAIGSQQRRVSIIPDYVFESDGKPFWILDAKAPTEDVVKSAHVEQAYSYAIHPEIRADYYALCNGHEFVLYDVRKFDPILRFPLLEIEQHWEKLYRLLNGSVRGNSELVDYAPDFGLFMKRLGADGGSKLVALACSTCFVMKAADGEYTLTTTVPGDVEMCMSIDFDEQQLTQLLSFQPDAVVQAVRLALSRQPYYASFDPSEMELHFGVVARLSSDVLSNNEESYIPFIVEEFKPHMHSMVMLDDLKEAPVPDED